MLHLGTVNETIGKRTGRLKEKESKVETVAQEIPGADKSQAEIGNVILLLFPDTISIR